MSEEVKRWFDSHQSHIFAAVAVYLIVAVGLAVKHAGSHNVMF